MERSHIATGAFSSLEERAQLVRFCAAMSGNSEVAEDLAQETLLEAWRHEQALRDLSRRSQWLMGIARNICLRWQRKQGREGAHRYQEEIIEHEHDEIRAEQVFVDDYDINLEFERKELLELLEQALALLPAETRAALLLHSPVFQGISIVVLGGAAFVGTLVFSMTGHHLPRRFAFGIGFLVGRR